MSKLYKLQQEIFEWHNNKYPDRDIYKMALKLCEEAGEVAGSVIKKRGTQDTIEELCDVLIVAITLLAELDAPIDIVLNDRFREVKKR